MIAGQSFGEHFTIEDLIGAGGMGAVYRLKHKYLGTYSALKVIRPQSELDEADIRRFLNEAKLIREMHHPNIVRVQDFGVTKDGAPYQILDYIDGFDLAPKSNSDKLAKLSFENKIDIAIQVADALAHAHERGIIHRDIKSSNILVSLKSDGSATAHVIDFGIAKAAEHDGRTLTKTGQLVGSPAYISPEQALGTDLDGRSDIYSFGVVLYELFTGQLPFKPENAMAQIVARLQQPVPTEPLKTLPQSLRRIILTCLDSNREGRYANATLLAKDLNTVKEGKRTALSKKEIKALVMVGIVGIAVIAGVGYSCLFFQFAQTQMKITSDMHSQFGAALELDNRAATYFNNGQFREALDLLEYGQKVADRKVKENPSWDNKCFREQNLAFIGFCHAGLHDWQKGADILQEPWNFYLDHSRRKHPHTQQLVDTYANCLEHLDRKPEADAVRRQYAKFKD